MTPNGENSISLLSYQSGSIWYGIAGAFPYTWHWRQATFLDLGCSEVVQRMIIAGFPSHANRPGQILAANTHSSCYPLDRDNHCTRALRPVTRGPFSHPLSVLHLPIFTRSGSVVVDYSNGTEMSWYLSAWVTCQTLASRAVVDGPLEVGTVVMGKRERELPRR